MDISSLLTLFMEIASSFSLLNLTSVGMLQVALWIILAFVGVVVHLMVDINKGVISASNGDSLWNRLWVYLLKDHPLASIRMVLSVAGLAVAYFSAMPPPVSWGVLVIAALTAGYTSDSLFNRTTK